MQGTCVVRSYLQRLSCCDTRRWSNRGMAASRMQRWTLRLQTSAPPVRYKIKIKSCVLIQFYLILFNTLYKQKFQCNDYCTWNVTLFSPVETDSNGLASTVMYYNWHQVWGARSIIWATSYLTANKALKFYETERDKEMRNPSTNMEVNKVLRSRWEWFPPTQL
jgi:hypothetical protein